MRNLLFSGTPLKDLFRDLTGSLKSFVREEVELAKVEMSEKMSCYGHNAVSVAIGGFVAYAGLIVLLGGLGLLVGFGFKKLNLDPALANFIGLTAVGLIVIIVGAVMVLKGVKAFSTASLAPTRTIATLKHFKGADEREDLVRELEAVRKQKRQEAPRRSADELKAEVLATEDHIGDTLHEIAYRASPARVKDRAIGHLRTHPYTWSLGALGSGIVSGLLLMQKRRFGRSRLH